MNAINKVRKGRAGKPFSGAYQQNVKRQINSVSSATRAQRAVKLYKQQAALVYMLSNISSKGQIFDIDSLSNCFRS